jgi:rhodanese-related sulfurtransferase
MPPVPDYFSRCSDINRVGPSLLSELPDIEGIEPDRFESMVERENTVVFDVRNYESFGSFFIKGSYNINLFSNFATFAGWILPPGKNILLVANNLEQVNEAAILLRRVGFDSVLGYLDGGMFDWVTMGFPTEHIGQLSVEDFHSMTVSDRNMTLVDVRSPNEYQQWHIDGARNIPVPDLRTRYGDLNQKDLTVLICSTGIRSSLGASILKQHEFENIFHVAGGMAGLNAAGYGAECPVCTIPHGPQIMEQSQRL